MKKIGNKKVEELDFSSDVMFRKIMRDENLCKRILESLLKIKIEKIVYHKTQKWIRPLSNSHGVRLDVYLKDANRQFNLEMQTQGYGDLPKRVRYYQGCMDADSFRQKQPYDMLLESYVIFICKEDPFNLGIPVYTVKSHFAEKFDVIYDDFSRKVFYNASAWNKSEDEEVKAFLKYIATQEATSDLTNDIDKRIRYMRRKFIMTSLFQTLINIQPFKFFADMEWEKDEARYAGRCEGLKEGREEGRKSGLEEGRAKGLKEGRKEAAAEMQPIIDRKDAEIAALRAQLAELQAQTGARA